MAILVIVGEVENDEFWTLQEAGREIGMSSEGVRLWTMGDQPRVRTKRIMEGRRERVLVNRSDVLREAALRTPSRSRTRAVASERGPSVNEELRDRVSVLEEVVRRHRIINEHQEVIVDRYREIARQREEIEELLLAPSWAPDA